MTPSRALFEERSAEITLYFELLNDLIDKDARLIFPLPLDAPADTPQRQKSIPKDLTHTLKANGILLLYNLMEATMATAIEDIHTQIEADPELGLDDLSEPLRRRALERFKPTSDGLAEHLRHPLSRSMLRHWLEDHRKSIKRAKNPLFSGNIDAKLIRDIAAMYGFSAQTDAEKTRNGGNLVKVMTKRNELAHGSLAFKECGTNLSFDELLRIKDEVINYLDGILSNIETYINQLQYLRNPSSGGANHHQNQATGAPA